jgi:hypothetical protein
MRRRWRTRWRRGGRAKNVEENESRSRSGWNFARQQIMGVLHANEKIGLSLRQAENSTRFGQADAWNSTTRKSVILSLSIAD